VRDPLKHDPPHLCYHAEFDRSRSVLALVRGFQKLGSTVTHPKDGVVVNRPIRPSSYAEDGRSVSNAARISRGPKNCER